MVSPVQKGFDNKKYLALERHAVLRRAKKFDTLFFEIGGHLLFDGHAQRVLPGYNPKNKIQLLKSLNADVGIVYCVSAKAIQQHKAWSNSGLTADQLALNEVRKLRKEGLTVIAFAVTLFEGEQRARAFIKKLEKSGETVVVSGWIKEYPKNLANVFGKKGFAAQPFLFAEHKIIAVTGTGANNGKLFFCLNQIYHYDALGLSAGYAKLETFPIWNVPLNHEVNIAYEAATADIKDTLVIDPFHKKAYGILATNYNRDVESFPLLKKIIQGIAGKGNYMHAYQSPTDMGINFAKRGIVNDNVVREAARQEILQRYELFKQRYKEKMVSKKTLERMKDIILKVQWPA